MTNAVQKVIAGDVRTVDRLIRDIDLYTASENLVLSKLGCNIPPQNL
jgi:hypothetical protein